jgi:hypothetical protein
MAIGQTMKVTGYITKDKFLVGRPLFVLEGYLGFHQGRLSRGATFVKLNRFPLEDEFELAAYSITAAHRHVTHTGQDISKLRKMAIASWRLSGPDRLIKVIAAIEHDRNWTNDDQYPPGAGVPQWKIRRDRPIEGTIVAELSAVTQTYKPAL